MPPWARQVDGGKNDFAKTNTHEKGPIVIIMPPDESFASDVDDLKNYTAIDSSSSCITVDYKMKKKIVQ